MKYVIKVVIAISASLVFAFVAESRGYLLFSEKAKLVSRFLVCDAYGRLKLGDDFFAVREVLLDDRYSKSHIVFSEMGVGGTHYILESPVEFPLLTGAWHLFLAFDGGVLVCMRIGDFDGNTYVEAPDIGQCATFLGRDGGRDQQSPQLTPTPLPNNLQSPRRCSLAHGLFA